MKIRFIYAKNMGPDIKKGFWRWAKAQVIGQGIVIWTAILAVVRFDWKSLKFNFRHVEVWFPDEDGNFNKGSCGCHFCYEGQCFSSTTRGDAEGVRFAPASEVLHHPERWVYQEYEVGDNLQLTKETMEKYIGCSYDFAGIVGFFSPINTEVKEKWYCSEICAYIAWTLVLTKELHKRISPRRLAKVLGGKLFELK